MAFDWMSKLFQGSEQTRGLSGSSASAVALDDTNSFYNFRLRRHATRADLLADPGRIWSTSTDPQRATGLSQHLADDAKEGIRFSDLLVVLSKEDHARALATGGTFAEELGTLVADHVDELRRATGGGYVERPAQVKLVADGSEAVGGTDFGLGPGEFITGVVPNLYVAPGLVSRAVIGLHLNLPGVWEGYREVGRLYDDQVLFTLGSHWLDNFHHPNLGDAALYRLQRSADGSFYHIINPDLQDRYQVTSVDQDGTSVLTLATREGVALAYLVLAIVDDLPAAVAPRAEAPAALEATPKVAPPMMVEPRSRGLKAKTIVPEAHQERIFTLQERGALLQRVHFGAFMLGYDVYFGTRGELGTVVEDVAVVFEVRKKSINLRAHAEGVRVNGETVERGEVVPVEGDVRIAVGAQELFFHELRGVDVDGWPYVGEIRRPATSTYMLWGRTYDIGRSRECRVVLPDEPENANIVWKPGIGNGATIRSKTGEIPKSRFYTDSIMVASEHAAVDLSGEVPEAVCTARHCYAYIRRDDAILPLYPTRSGKVPQRLPLEPNDELLVGNCVFHVGFVGEQHQARTSPAPRVSVSSDSLVDAVSAVSFEGMDAPAPASFSATDVPEPMTAPPAPSRAAFASLTDAPLPRALPTTDFGTPVDPLEVDRVELPAIEDAFEDERPTSPLGFGLPDPDVEPIAPPAALDPVVEADEPTAEAEPLAPAPREEAPVAPAVLDDPWDVPGVSAAPNSFSLEAGTPARVGRKVLVVDADAAQFELGRPAHLVLTGWMARGELRLGNHAAADLAFPESRFSSSQTFLPKEYGRLTVRGKKLSFTPEDVDDLRSNQELSSGVPVGLAEGDGLEVIRRDEDGEEDFSIVLSWTKDRTLPDPRAIRIDMDREDPLVASLFTLGLPLRADRPVELGPLVLTARWDGASAHLSDYLDTYRRDDSTYVPFFHRSANGRFRTAPEDGAAISLAPGDQILVGTALYELVVDA